MKGVAICSGRAAAKIAAPGSTDCLLTGGVSRGGSGDQLSARTYDIGLENLNVILLLEGKLS
jgi:hypothetical protein